MNFDVLTLAAVRGEIEDRAVGGRIQRVAAPEPNQIGLEIYANRAAHHLLIQAGSGELARAFRQWPSACR